MSKKTYEDEREQRERKEAFRDIDRFDFDFDSLLFRSFWLMFYFSRIYLTNFLSLFLFSTLIDGQFDWIVYDKIDEIMDRINSVNSVNCFQKQPSELVLPEESVYQKPSIDMLRKDIINRNRTQLLHVRNIAHRNALLYSYLFQRLFDLDEPGLTYILLHNAGSSLNFLFESYKFFLMLSADVSGGRGMINGSGIFFDQNKYYPHWYKNFFNKTIPLFGPYAWRADDFYGQFKSLFTNSI